MSLATFNPQVYYQAWKSVVTLQKLHRGRVIKSIVRQLLTAASILKSGNIFLKFSKDGTPPPVTRYAQPAPRDPVLQRPRLPARRAPSRIGQ